MAGKDLRGIIDRIVDLPTLPQVVSTIMSLLDDPTSSAKDINSVMSNDPALAARILKLVNSAFYGLPNRVSSIQSAIAILGFNTVKSLAISASVFDLFGGGGENFSYEEFWAHSVGTATVGRHLAQFEPGVNPDTMFVVGLLHGMGKLVLDQYAPAEFQDILILAADKCLSFAQAEPEVISTSYSELGYWLACKWQLDGLVQNAIRYQNDIPACPPAERPAAALVAFASYVCRVKEYGASGDFNKPTLPRAAWECLHLAKDKLAEIVEEINQELLKADSFLRIINS